jgi:hypothetical protein
MACEVKKMDVNILIQAVSTVGFPIAACCVMFMQNNKLQDTLKDISVTMQKMADAIDDMEKKNDKGN